MNDARNVRRPPKTGYTTVRNRSAASDHDEEGALIIDYGSAGGYEGSRRGRIRAQIIHFRPDLQEDPPRRPEIRARIQGSLVLNRLELRLLFEFKNKLTYSRIRPDRGMVRYQL